MYASTRIPKLLIAAVAAVAAFILAAPATMAAEAPAPGYEQFAGCPSPEENPNPAIVFCSRTVIDGGHVQMGSKDVPIKNPITLSGGVLFPSGDLVANSKGGLAPVKQLVPGGIVGLTGLDWLVNFLGVEALKLYATTELAGKPGSAFATPLTLPLRVHLENPVLGTNCYIGSFTNPIVLNLITGTTSPPPPNTPISGQEPSEFEDTEKNITFLTDGIFVDNSFAAPAANGCQLNLGFIHIGIDSLVNSVSGLPAAAGTNEAVQNFDAELTTRSTVYP